MIIQGNSFRLPLADKSVHVICTSPPYWGLRDYNLPPLVWGGDANCQHEWGEEIITKTSDNYNNGFNERWGNASGQKKQEIIALGKIEQGQFCHLCGAWLGSYGLEPTISLYIQHSVEIARELWRVLRDDGVMWWNLGDTYATARNGRSAADGKALGNDDRTFRDKPFTVDEIPAKNLCLIPERIVIALQDDGWIVRSVASWIKKNPMPESTLDRPGTAHEYIFMLTKSPRYFWDMENVRRENKTNGGKTWDERKIIEPSRRGLNVETYPPMPSMARNPSGRALRTSDFFFDSLDAYIAHLQGIRDNGGLMLQADGSPAAFVVNPKGYKFSHYATFPIDLVAPMIKASTSERGCCRACGAPWVRVVEKETHLTRPIPNEPKYAFGFNGEHRTKAGLVGRPISEATTLGWRPSCDCSAGEPVPALVLDPFVGSGTVVLAAQQLGRRGIGVDLNPTYLLENALPRTEKKGGRAISDLPLFSFQESPL